MVTRDSFGDPVLEKGVRRQGYAYPAGAACQLVALFIMASIVRYDPDEVPPWEGISMLFCLAYTALWLLVNLTPMILLVIMSASEWRRRERSWQILCGIIVMVTGLATLDINAMLALTGFRSNAFTYPLTLLYIPVLAGNAIYATSGLLQLTRLSPSGYGRRFRDHYRHQRGFVYLLWEP
jgi:hypothetical protein